MSEHPIKAKIGPDGELLLITHPNQGIDADALGTVQDSQRGGYVWPFSCRQRPLFRLLRWLFGSSGKVADWTRTWPGPWVIVDPVRGLDIPMAFPSHAAAVEYEVKFIELGDGDVVVGFYLWMVDGTED